jgi:predicted kinase
MSGMRLKKPTLLLMLGPPGAGKSFFARQISEALPFGHVSGDRIRYELFEEPRYDADENNIVMRIMDYMTEELLASGVSVIYDDISLLDYHERLQRRDMATKAKVTPLTVWVQTDLATAYTRASTRDRRRSDEKYSRSIDRTTFDTLANALQPPQFREDYVVISGKYVFKSQLAAIVKKLRDIDLLEVQTSAPPAPSVPIIRPLSTPRREQPTRRIRIR